MRPLEGVCLLKRFAAAAKEAFTTSAVVFVAANDDLSASVT